jgi:hypothetical protein
MNGSRYVEAEQYLRTLHAMIEAGKGSSDRADELREEATLIWKQLTPVEQQQLQRLSSELAEAATGNRRSEGSAIA